MGTDAKILTETLWDQTGTIYVPDPDNPGKSIKLEGFCYNDDCPVYLFQDNFKARSATGCSNTVAAQIIYYWLQKGADLSFSVKDTDQYSIANYPTQKSLDEGKGYATISVTADKNADYFATSVGALNAALADVDLQDGTFISALNFYSGIKNSSSFGDSTSTSAGSESSTAGDEYPVYKASGFESFNYIASGDSEIHGKKVFEPTTIIQKGKEVKCSRFTEFGYSLIRECIDYGEPMLLGIDGHDVYIDGYEKQEDGSYLYHINYGWGGTFKDGVLTPDEHTKWYTADEITQLQPDDIYFDLDPDISVAVTNDSPDYVAGSMLRGLSRIDNVRKAKTVTVSFDESLNGKTISLKEAWQTSNENKCGYLLTENGVNFSFDSYYGFLPSADLTLQSYHGFTVVNSSDSKKSHWAYSVYDKGVLAAEVSGGGVFAATTEEDNEDILEALQNYAEKGISAVADYIEDLAEDYAFGGGTGNDTLTIVDKSIVIGDIDLGKGNNVITIDSSSLWVGDLASAASVNLLMNEAEEEAVICLRSGDKLAFKNNAALTVTLADADEYAVYSIVDTSYASDKTALDGFTVSVKSSDEVIASELGIGDYYVSGLNDYALIYDKDILSLKVSHHDFVTSDYNVSNRSDVIQIDSDNLVYVLRDTENGYELTSAVNDVTGWKVLETRKELTGDSFADIQISADDGDGNTWVAVLRNDYSDGNIILNYQEIGAYDNELWDYLASADVNGDGKSEVLMIQTEKGADPSGHRNVASWITDESSAWIGNKWVGSLTSEWNVIGTADVTGDGAENVLLRRADGTIACWSEAGTNNIVELGDADESILLTGANFSGGDASDLLFTNVYGDFFTWKNTDTRMVAEYIGNLSDLGEGWSFAGTGDYDGDGKEEILWYCSADATIAYGKADRENFVDLKLLA